MTSLRPVLLRQALAPSIRVTRSSTLPAFLSKQQSALRIPVAAFQTSAHRAILPPLPQRIGGDVNEPAPVPDPDPAHGSYHWSAERVVSVALIPLTIAPFAAGAMNPMADGLLIGTLLIHSHMGFQASITDYFPKWRVPKIRKALDWTALAALFVVGWGWYEFETNDVGLTEGIRRIWTARKRDLAVAS